MYNSFDLTSGPNGILYILHFKEKSSIILGYVTFNGYRCDDNKYYTYFREHPKM